jgi:hypothetical protein
VCDNDGTRAKQVTSHNPQASVVIKRVQKFECNQLFDYIQAITLVIRSQTLPAPFVNLCVVELSYRVLFKTIWDQICKQKMT